ncbi:MAG: ArsR family transcriptional regulator [Actinobacteria bacterium]|nr:ArsR family transcriptional regulator [Actinomycetota bacterium]MTA90452.1 ArsR family transcriptional regulator [Actinomycetota bacterium]
MAGVIFLQLKKCSVVKQIAPELVMNQSKPSEHLNCLKKQNMRTR